MGWADVGTRGAFQEKVSDTSIAGSPTSAIPVGAIAVVYVVTNNIATVDGDGTDISVTDTDGHTWTRLKEYVQSAGAAADGVQVAQFATKVTSEIGTGDTVTVTFSAASAAKCFGIHEFSVAAGKTFAVADAVGAVGATANPSVTSGTISSAERLWLGLVGIEALETRITADDADYTDACDADGRIGTTGGGETTNVALSMEYRIATLTADTYAVTTVALDWVAIIVALDEVDEAGGNATATPATVAAVAAVPVPTVLAAATAAPATVAAVAAAPAPTVVATGDDEVVAPATVAVLAAVPAPSVAAAALVALPTVAATAAVPAPTVVATGGDVTVAPSTVVAVAIVPPPTTMAEARAPPATVAATAAIPTPSVRGAATVMPATAAAVAAIVAPNVVITGSQGPRSGGTFADDATVGLKAWTNPGDALSSNDVRATAQLDATNIDTHLLKVTNFGFSIPGDATITGIVLAVERRDGIQSIAHGVEDMDVRLYKAGALVGTDKAVAGNWPETTDETVSYGSSSDLWGTTWTPAEINAVGFGAGVAAQRTQGSPLPEIDHVTITVYYTATGGGNAVVAAATVEGLASIPDPTIVVAANAVAAPATVAATTAVPAPTVKAGVVATPATASATATVPTPSVRGAAVVGPASVAALAAVPVPPVIGAAPDALATPPAVGALAAVPAPDVAGSAVVSPSSAAALATVPAPAIGAGADSTAQPGTVAAVASVPPPSIIATFVLVTAGLVRAWDAAVALVRAVSRLVGIDRPSAATRSSHVARVGSSALARARVLDQPLHAVKANDVQRTV